MQLMRRELPLQKDSYQYEEVDFSQNELTSIGLKLVLEVCRRCPKLRIFKLYKNQIGDSGAQYLAELCKVCPNIEEMHLSHNHLTAEGVDILVTAAEQVRPDYVSPLWLRLEHNDVTDPENTVRDLQSRLSVCTRVDEVRCTVRSCCNKQKIHLPFFNVQRIGGRGNGPRDAIPAAAPSPMAAAAAEAAAQGAPSFRVPRNAEAAGQPPSAQGRPAVAKAANGSAWGGAKGGAWGAANGAGAARGWGAPAAVSNWGTRPSGPGAGNSGYNSGSGIFDDFGKKPAGSVTGAGVMSASHAEKPSAPAELPTAANWNGPGPPHAAGGGSWGPAASPLGDMQKSREENLDLSPTPMQQRKAMHEPARRSSMVLDSNGRRRILPKQLEAEANSQFVCPLCSFVIIRPVMTSCSHLFCDTCFRTWVQDQVSKQKKGPTEGGPVPLIPCPQPTCNTKLRKKDIMPMDSRPENADSTKVGAVQLLQRLRNNLQIRCVHHCTHFKYSFGKDAERVSNEAGFTCKWVGDLAAYEVHLNGDCPIEKYLNGRGPAPPVENGRICAGSSPKTSPKHTPGSGGENTGKALSSPARNNGTADNSESPGDDGEERVARYDYVPRDAEKAQIALKMNDLVRIFEVTESGWAAGVRLSRETKDEIGDAGWFPVGYLYPPGHPVAG